MCFTDEFNTVPASADVGMRECVEYQIQSYVQEERIEPMLNIASTSSRTSTIESSTLPPSYDECASEKPRGKVGFLRRFFHRIPKNSPMPQELPSYRDVELARAWAKVGIDINDAKHGPRPACTPEEWIRSLQDSLLL